MSASGTQQHNPVLSGLLLLLYIASLLLPAVQRPNKEELSGSEVFVDSLKRAHDEIRQSGILRVSDWMANPLLCLAFWALFKQRWLLASGLAAVAFGVGLYSVCIPRADAINNHLCIGSYLWLCSMVGVTYVANLNWRYRLIGR